MPHRAAILIVGLMLSLAIVLIYDGQIRYVLSETDRERWVRRVFFPVLIAGCLLIVIGIIALVSF